MSELYSLSLYEIQQGLQSRHFSARELMSALLQRIDQYTELNCFAEIDAEFALRSADDADEKLKNGSTEPLTGIPVGLKDIISDTHYQTRAASKILEGYRSPYNSTVTEYLKNNGAIIAAKTNMDEFAMGSSNENSAYGPVKNPWNMEHVPGGSSGGSAAAVAASLLPGTYGTDTGGSIRQPASFCGIVGMKPTYGRVSRYGIIAFASSLDQVGPFARSVKDCAILLEAVAGHDPRDSTSVAKKVPQFSKQLNPDLKGIRIGLPEQYFIEGLNTEIREAVEKATKTMEQAGATLVPVKLPHTDKAVATYYILAPAEASSNLARYDGVRYGSRYPDAENLLDMYEETRSAGFGPEVKRRILIGTYVLSSGYYDAFYKKAQKVRALIKQDFDTVFENDCDVIACPVTPTTAFRIGEKVQDPLSMYLNDIFTIPVNLAGLPGMSIPCGIDSNNLPVGLQLIGKAWDEQTLFNVACGFEEATDWNKKRPEEI